MKTNMPMAMLVLIGGMLISPQTPAAGRASALTGSANGLCSSREARSAGRVMVDRGIVVHLTGCEEIKDSVTGCILKLVGFTETLPARACFTARTREDYVIVSHPDLCVGPQDIAVGPSRDLCADITLEVIKASPAPRDASWLGHVLVTIPDHP